jgi:hypothetical protein
MGDSSGMPAAEGSTSNTSRTMTRRTVARGIAWSAPLAAVSVAAPAYASSIPCQVTTVLDSLTPGQPVGVLTFLPSTVTATIAFANGAGSGQMGDTGEVAQTSTLPPWNYIEVEMTDPLNAGDYIDVTITLSQAVTNLSFRIHDIDKTGSQQQYGWNDEVWVQTAGFTFVRGTNVIGAGTDADAFRNNVFGDQAIDSGLNHVDLKWAGSVSQVKFRYRARNSGDSGNQHIGIGNISFSDCVANPTKRTGFAAQSRTVVGSFVPGETGDLVAGRDN